VGGEPVRSIVWKKKKEEGTGRTAPQKSRYRGGRRRLGRKGEGKEGRKGGKKMRREYRRKKKGRGGKLTRERSLEKRTGGSGEEPPGVEVDEGGRNTRVHD